MHHYLVFLAFNVSNGSHKSHEKSLLIFFVSSSERGAAEDTHHGSRLEHTSCVFYWAFTADGSTGAANASQLLYRSPAVSPFPGVHVCFKYLVHRLTFLASLCLGKHPASPLCCIQTSFHTALWRLYMCLGLSFWSVCVCVCGQRFPSAPDGSPTINPRKSLTFWEAQSLRIVPEVMIGAHRMSAR